MNRDASKEAVRRGEREGTRQVREAWTGGRRVLRNALLIWGLIWAALILLTRLYGV